MVAQAFENFEGSFPKGMTVPGTVWVHHPPSMNTELDATTLARLQSWVGKTDTLTDHVAATPVCGLAAALDRADTPPRAGDVLPELWHWLYFLSKTRQSEVGADGHPRRGGFLPPVPLPRRMWAGGRLQWHADNPLRIGDRVQRESHIASISHKSGRSGDLLFVVIRHVFRNDKGLALTEEHDIVYRAAARPGEAAPAPTSAAPGAPWRREIVPDPVLLFRYSALTFNGHRIHYDRTYVTLEEGYPGLVVHGPLIATLLVDLTHRERPDARLAAFQFKAVRPTFDLHPFHLSGEPSPDGQTARLWASDHEGWLTMQAEATFA